MPTYITLINWTDQGIRNVEEAPQRLDAGKKATEVVGGKMTSFYLTMGRYDTVIINEFPSDEAAATYLLSLGRLGNVRTETLKALTEEEFRNIVAKLT